MRILKKNMKKEGLFILVTILLLFSFTLVQAQPPFQTQPTNLIQGYFIEIPEQGIIKTGQDFTFYFHVFNISNGLALSNDSISCEFNLYDSSSVLIHTDTDLPFDSSSTIFFSEVKGENFTKAQDYNYITHCNGTDFGGGISVEIEATKTGTKLDTAEALTYFILAFGVLLLFILSFYFMISTPYGNKTNEKGAVIQLTKLKYVKLGLILLTWVLLTWFLNILIGLSDNFVVLTMYYGFFGFIFQVMNALALPVGIIIIVIALFEIIRDANILNNLKKFGSAAK